MNSFSYSLITSARNEEEIIGKCIESILEQSVLPNAWVIISDNSIDNTEIIVKKYAKKNKFIHLIKKNENIKQKGFSSKVFALNMGKDFLKDSTCLYFGHLDADITLEKEYYYKIICEFQKNKKLGISGGYIFEKDKAEFKSRKSNSPWSVAGGIQLFQKKCYKDVTPMPPMQFGGEDWYAEIKACMRGWEVKSFKDIIAYHHKSSKERRGFFKEGIRNGILHYVIGTHPIFEIVKILRRVKEKPFFIFAVLIFYGYFISMISAKNKVVSKDIEEFLQKEQIGKIKSLLIKCNYLK
jgi:glycosyltransferase involved in cell wall biosynthesis